MKTIVFITMLLCIAGCGSFLESKQEENHSSGVAHITLPSEVSLETVAANPVVVCKDPSQCLENVGMLTLLFTPDSSAGLGSCTGFLISEDTVMTNSHCIPTDIKYFGAHCSNRIWITFPATKNFQSESLPCDHVLYASNAASDKSDPLFLRSPDYAIFKLKGKTQRGPLKISTEGLDDDFPVSVYKVTPIMGQSSFYGLIEKDECHSIQSTMIYPSFNHRFRPVTTIAGCKIVHGNSGSPVLDSQGFVRAVVFAGILGKLSEQIPLVWATNLACARTTEFEKAKIFPSQCDLITPEKDSTMFAESMKQALDSSKEKMEFMVNAWAKENAKNFQWDTSLELLNWLPKFFNLNIEKILEYSPFKTYGGDFESKDRESILYVSFPIPKCIEKRFFKNENDSYFLAPLWVFKSRISALLKLETDVFETKGQVKMKVSLDSNVLHHTTKTSMTVQVLSQTGWYNVHTAKAEVGYCEP